MFQLSQNSDHLLCRELHKISHCSLDTAPSQLFAPCHLSFSASIPFFAASHRLSFPPIILIASTFYFSVDTGTDPIPVSSPLTQLLAIHPIIHFSLGVKIIIVINADLIASFFGAWQSVPLENSQQFWRIFKPLQVIFRSQNF